MSQMSCVRLCIKNHFALQVLQHVLSVLHAASHQHLWIVFSQRQKFSCESSLKYSNCTYENKYPSLFLKAAQVRAG